MTKIWGSHAWPLSELGCSRDDAASVLHFVRPWSWSAFQPADLAFWFDLGPALSLWTCWVLAGLLADPGYHHRAWSWPWLTDLVSWLLAREAAAPACLVTLSSQLAFLYRATCPCCFLTVLKEKNHSTLWTCLFELFWLSFCSLLLSPNYWICPLAVTLKLHKQILVGTYVLTIPCFPHLNHCIHHESACHFTLMVIWLAANWNYLDELSVAMI